MLSERAPDGGRRSCEPSKSALGLSGSCAERQETESRVAELEAELRSLRGE